MELNKGDKVEICINVIGYCGLYNLYGVYTGYCSLYCIRGVYEGENDNWFILKSAVVKDSVVVTAPENKESIIYIAKNNVVVVKKYV